MKLELGKKSACQLQREAGYVMCGEMVPGPWPHGTLTFKLLGHQQHREVLVDTSQPAAVNLQKLQSFRLQELLKYHSVVALERELEHQQEGRPLPSGSMNLALRPLQVTQQWPPGSLDCLHSSSSLGVRRALTGRRRPPAHFITSLLAEVCVCVCVCVSRKRP